MANWSDIRKRFEEKNKEIFDNYRKDALTNRIQITPEINNILSQRAAADTCDQLRAEYLNDYANTFNRNVIIYYSGFLRIKQDLIELSVEDNDMNGLMSAVCGMDKSKGLDLFLHTPGGSISAAESIVNYLRSIFGTDIRVIIPQIAMSAGTMIACCGKEIIMGKQSSLGPTDPQIRGLPTHGVLEEFDTARKTVLANNNEILLWREIISKYHPTFLGECKKAIKLSSELVTDWLKTGMFKDDNNAETIAKNIVKKHLNNHSSSKTHDRHFSLKTCKEFGLKIFEMESNQELQDKILSIHHATILSINTVNALKIIQSQTNSPWILTVN